MHARSLSPVRIRAMAQVFADSLPPGNSRLKSVAGRREGLPVGEPFWPEVRLVLSTSPRMPRTRC